VRDDVAPGSDPEPELDESRLRGGEDTGGAGKVKDGLRHLAKTRKRRRTTTRP
jgi:hypothetical protein